MNKIDLSCCCIVFFVVQPTVVVLPTPRKVIGNFKGEGVSKANICKGKYEAKPKIPGGIGVGGLNHKTFRGRGGGG